MKHIFPWMAPRHKAERTLYNYKMKHRIDKSVILEGEEIIQVIIYKNRKATMIYSVKNKPASYGALR